MSEAQQNSSDLLYLDIFEVLRRRYLVIVLGCVFGAGLALAYSVTARVRYESAAVVLVIPKDAGLPSGTGSSDLGMQSNVGEELLATHMQILTSPKVIRGAIMAQPAEGTPLFERPSFQETIPSELLGDDELKRKGVIAYIRKNLTVSRGGEGASKDAQVLRVRMQHTDKNDCRDLLNLLVDSYQTFLGEKVTNAGDEAGTLISKASQELEDSLTEQDKKYREFLETAPMLWSNNGDTLNPHQALVAQLETQLQDVRIKRFEVESRLQMTAASLAAADHEADPLLKLTIFDGADVERLGLLIRLESESFNRTNQERAAVANVQYEQLLELQQDAELASREVGPNHPKYLQTESRIASLKEFLKDRNHSADGSDVADPIDLDRLARLYEKLLRHDLSQLENRESKLVTLIQDETSLSKQLIAYELEEDSLRRARERTQTLYETVVENLREVNLAKDYGGFITELISPPNEGIKCWPMIPFLAALGSLIGLLGGATTAVVAELMDQSFKNHEDVERQLGSTVLAHVPLMLPKEMAEVDKSHPVQSAVVALHRPKSHQAEAFRSLRASVYFKTKGIEHPIIQVTSPNAGDGKSTVAANLAVSISQTNQRILLVDCDMRRPTVHKVFGLEANSLGMSSVLRGECSIEDATQEHARIPNLFLIPAGDVPENPAELLSLPSFTQFLEVVRDEFDIILIDSPPVGPVSDPITISSRVDFVLLAITLSKSARANASDCQTKLINNGAKILGLVVNRFGGSAKYAYGGGYGYKYQYNEKNSAYYSY